MEDELLRQATAELPRLVEAMRRIDPALRVSLDIPGRRT